MCYFTCNHGIRPVSCTYKFELENSREKDSVKEDLAYIKEELIHHTQRTVLKDKVIKGIRPSSAIYGWRQTGQRRRLLKIQREQLIYQ